MRKATIDIDEWIADMEDGKYKAINTEYQKGCNDVLDYYIKQFRELAENISEGDC